MSRKAYSEQERENIKVQLLKTSLELFSQRGFRGVRLIDIVTAIGISKPFFYTFYTSLEELVVKTLEYQANLLYDTLEALKAAHPCRRQMMIAFMQKVIYSKENHFFIMTQEEEVWVYNHLKPENFIAFQKGQETFYTRILNMFGVSAGQCSPKLFANMILSILLVYNSAQRSLPFLYTDILEQTAQAQAEALADYLMKVSS